MQTLERPTLDKPLSDFEEEAKLVATGVWCPKHRRVHKFPGGPAHIPKGDSIQFTCELDRVTFKVVGG